MSEASVDGQIAVVYAEADLKRTQAQQQKWGRKE